MSAIASDTPFVRVRIRKVPPTTSLEGFDLRPFAFLEGHTYELTRALATMLVVWGYAEPAERWDERN